MKTHKTIDLTLQASRILFVVSGGTAFALNIMCLVNRAHYLPIHPVQLIILCFYCMLGALAMNMVASMAGDIIESSQQATLGLRRQMKGRSAALKS